MYLKNIGFYLMLFGISQVLVSAMVNILGNTRELEITVKGRKLCAFISIIGIVFIVIGMVVMLLTKF